MLVPRLQDGNGLDVLRALHAADSTLHLLILDTFRDDESMRAAKEGGASGYLLKQIDGRALSEALRRAAAGEFLFAA